MTKRDDNIDLIRILAAIAVVGLHTFPKDLSVWTASAYSSFGFAIPFFFMASGFFLLNRGEIGWAYSWKKTYGIIKVVFCWNLIFFVAKFLKQFVFQEEITIEFLTLRKEIIKSFFQKGSFFHFWYLGALIILYLMFANFIKNGGKTKNKTHVSSFNLPLSF